MMRVAENRGIGAAIFREGGKGDGMGGGKEGLDPCKWTWEQKMPYMRADRKKLTRSVGRGK